MVFARGSFVKAFKELVSNAYDADATEVSVTLSEDFSSMDVLDNGIGMTPFDFHESFARIGGSTAWLQEGTSPGGRPRIIAVPLTPHELHSQLG